MRRGERTSLEANCCCFQRVVSVISEHQSQEVRVAELFVTRTHTWRHLRQSCAQTLVTKAVALAFVCGLLCTHTVLVLAMTCILLTCGGANDRE